MIRLSRKPMRSTATKLIAKQSLALRKLTTQARAPRKEGDISSVFVSLSGKIPDPLPERFAKIKRDLIQGKESQVFASWNRLLKQLAAENKIVKLKGSDIIPQIKFEDLNSAPDDFLAETRKRGVAVIKGVVPEKEARNYKTEIEEYVRLNPQTKAFPPNNPQVFELYWSPSQLQARSHPNIITSQKFLTSLWHSTNPSAKISTQPLTYADRLRIRQPGDAQFALGPHIDGGSVERWEPTGYGLGNVYSEIFSGNWDEYDPWESSCRVPVQSDLYYGSGSCSMFRMFQGWLGLSNTGPREGTLLVNPLLQLSTAYILLRPFFDPIRDSNTPGFLSAENWKLKTATDMDTVLHGANPGSGQELNDVFHPHLQLKDSMAHIPEIKPGDFVVWHCDTIHAVDSVHQGTSDSSVIYIPVCPTTESNVEYLARQREFFLNGSPAPDFPGGVGESGHIGRGSIELLAKRGEEALRSMGLAKLKTEEGEGKGAEEVVKKGNEILGFA